MKLFPNIILLLTVVFTLSSSTEVRAGMFAPLQQTVKIQDTTKKDTTKNNIKKGPSEKVEYKSLDSDYDAETGIANLYGDARLSYQDFQLDADYIRYDSKKKIIFARGTKNAKGKYIGRPVFKSKEGTGSSDSLIYNADTKELFIFGLFTEQEGGYFSGGISKKQPDDEIHVKNIDFSTCNQEHPHFSIHITKGIVTQKNIISSWLYFKAEDVPLPLGLPFAFIPKPNKKTSGFIIGTPTEDPTRGFMFENFGYYLGLNDYWDAKFLGTITTRGSWNASLNSNYTKRYKYGGNIAISYASTRLGLEGTPAYKPRKDYSIQWSHQQNANARPGTTFSASVNAQTSEYNRVTAGSYTYDMNQISQNALRSSISYGKTLFDGLVNFNASLGHSQETERKTVSLILPDFSLNMSSLSPFKSSVGEPKWYEKFTIGYSLQGRNSIDTYDSLLFRKETLYKFKNGFQHTVPMSLAFNLFNYLNFTTGMNYNERWYLQTIDKRFYKTATGYNTIIDTVAGFKRAGDYSLSIGMTTKLYSKVIEFKNLGNIKALRHVMTPNISISYNPDFTSTRFGIYKNAVYADGSPVIDAYTGTQVKYSTFEQGIFGGPTAQRSANLGFGLENNVELKVADKGDTTGTGMKKIPIIQSFTINGFYNFVAKEKKLSNLSFSGRSQLSDKLGFNFNGILSPYQVGFVKDLSGNGLERWQETNRYTFQDGKLPRLTNFGLSFDYSFNPDALKRKNVNLDELKEETMRKGATPEQADQLAMISRDPNAFVDFKLPWNFAFSYSFQYSNPLSLKGEITNTLNFNGDVNLTPKWKVQFNSGYDFKAKNLSYTSFAIYRDLHCWDLSFNWVPFGEFQSYSVDLKVRASILQDLKLTKRKAYYTRF